MRSLSMNYSRIFLRHFFLALMLFAVGFMFNYDISASESIGEIEKNEDIPVIFNLEENYSEEFPVEISIPLIPPDLSIEDFDDVIVVILDRTDTDNNNSFPELLVPEVQILEGGEDLVLISPLFSSPKMEHQKDEEKTVIVSSKVTEPSIKLEVPIEILPENDLLTLIPGQVKKEVVEDTSTSISVNERQKSVSIGSEVDITLLEHGWIYLPDKNNMAIEYIGRRFLNDSTVFTFLSAVEGSAVLQFQFQDLVENKHIIERVNLTVLPKENTFGKESLSLPVEIELPGISASMDLNESLQNFLTKGDNRGLSEITPALVESTLPSIRKQLPEVAELLFNSSYFVQSALIVENLLEDHTANIPMDRMLFLLGKIYEEDSSIRNEHTSVDFYKKLIDGYPTSIYWDESQDRYTFLKRRYIDIR